MVRLFLMVLLLSCTKKNNNLYNINYKYEEKSSTIYIKIDLQSETYAYAKGEKIGKPVNFVVLKDNNWKEAEEPVIPLGNEKNLIENSFTIKQKLIKGNGPGKGILYLHVCTKDFCGKPQEHEITW